MVFNPGLITRLPTIVDRFCVNAAAIIDRRRSQRKPHVVQAWIASPTALDPEDRREVTSVNVSRHGVEFESNHAVATGTFHVIDIAMGSQQIRTEVRIENCRKLENGRYGIGAEFA